MDTIVYKNLGLIHYKKAWDYQLSLFNELLANKNNNKINSHHHLLFCCHPHVFTIGRNGNDNNLLINKDLLQQKQIDLYHIDRGGDITYHGPGQQVVYPIFDLDQFGINTKEFVFRLEEAVINTLAYFSIEASRLEGAAGIWLDATDKSKSRKICAVGIRSSKRVTMHGIALNINTNLNYFSYMNPCGFKDRGVTSMQKELGHDVDIELVQAVLRKQITAQFSMVTST